MSKPDLSTTEGVLDWVMAQAEDLYHARGSDAETAAYIADAVTMYKQRLENHPATTKRALENERLRVAFDEIAKAYLMGWPEGERIILKHLRNAMKGGDK